MNVFQAPIEIAGQMGLLTKGLRALGHQVDSYNTWSNYLSYRKHIHNVDGERLPAVFEKRKSEFDVFHFHYGVSFMPHHAEFRYARDHAAVAVMHYWGSDVRTERKAISNNPYAKLIGEFSDEDVIQRHLKLHSKYLSACIVQDFEVVPYVVEHFDRIYVLPITIDLKRIEPWYPSGSVDEPLIMHAPTQPHFKGTAYIEEALDRLRADGLRFRYQKIVGLPHDEAILHYQTADIVIDQVLCGSHGLFAVEAMACGKPVVSFIREDLKFFFQDDFPIQSANPATLYDTIRRLLIEPATWPELGRRGREYVERNHAVAKVAKALNWIYERERALHRTGHHQQSPPCVIHLMGENVRCYLIDPNTRHVHVEQSPVQETANY